MSCVCGDVCHHRDKARVFIASAMSSHNSKRRKRVSEAPVLGRFDCAFCRRNVRGETHLRHEDPGSAPSSACAPTATPTAISSMARNGPRRRCAIDTAATGRPLLVEDWLADQEVRLLEGILQYGFGNWRAVAEHMGGDKTEQNCEDHYDRFYVRAKTFPLPDLSGPPAPVAPPPAAAGSSAERRRRR